MKLKLVSWIREAHGKSGDTVFREVNGETIVADKPGKRKEPLSDKQTEVQYRFTDARDFYRKVKLVPELLAMYEKAAEAAGKSVYMMCRKDWYSVPLVRGLELAQYHGQAGGVIKFKVQDDILAAKAIVTLSDEEEGTLIEWGMPYGRRKARTSGCTQPRPRSRPENRSSCRSRPMTIRGTRAGCPGSRSPGKRTFVT